MKRLIAVVVILLASWMTAMSQAQVMKSQDLSLKGVAVPGSSLGTIMLVGKSEGSLPGSFEISIWYNPITNKVIGGTWKVIVPQQGLGGASKAQGALAGSVTSGTVTLDKNGRVNSIEGVQMNIRRGVGQYSRIARGSGKLNGTLNLRRQNPFVGRLNVFF